MENKTQYAEELDRTLHAYRDEPNESGLYSVWYALFDGIESNYALPCPVRLEEDDVSPLFYKTNDGREYLAVLTRLDVDRYVMVADVKLRSILRLVFEVNECDGILLNPNQDNEFVLPKRFIAFAFTAAQAYFEDFSNDKA